MGEMIMSKSGGPSAEAAGMVGAWPHEPPPTHSHIPTLTCARVCALARARAQMHDCSELFQRLASYRDVAHKRPRLHRHRKLHGTCGVHASGPEPAHSGVPRELTLSTASWPPRGESYRR